MSRCPHCQTDTIGYFAKHASWRGRPVQCKNCKGFSFVAKHATGWGNAANLALLLIPVALVASLVIVSWWPLVIIVATCIALFIAHEVALYRAPLIATSTTEIAHARKSSLRFAALLLIVAAVASALSWQTL